MPDRGPAQTGLFDEPSPVKLDSSGVLSRATEMVDELFAAHPMRRKPTVEGRKFRTTAGTASFTRWSIALNLALLNEEGRLRETVVHEYAHLLAFERHGRKAANHGPHWRAAMRELGSDPEVKHRYACERNKPRQVVVYRCLKCGAILERARRLPRRRIFVHASCGGGLTLHEVRSRVA